MKKSTFSPAQIAGILKEFDNGQTAEEITREHGVSKASLYKWRQRYGGMEATELKRIKGIRRRKHPFKNVCTPTWPWSLDTAKWIIEKKL